MHGMSVCMGLSTVGIEIEMVIMGANSARVCEHEARDEYEGR